MKTFDPDKHESLEPIPVKKLGEDIIFVDGHTRAFAAFLHNLSEVPVYWEDEELTGMPMKSVWNGAKKRGFTR